MADLRVGCADLPPQTSVERYFESFDFLETTLLWQGIPGARVLRRWADAAPTGALAVIAPATLSGDRLASGAAAEDQCERLAEAATTLGAAVVIFRTRAGLTPSSAGRDAVRRFFGEVATASRFSGRDRVWLPDGLWELGTTAELSRDVGVVVAIDPLVEDPGADSAPALALHLARSVAYLRPSATARPRGVLSAGDRDALIALGQGVARAFIAVASRDPVRDARALKRLAADLAGGGGQP
jgi:hypothetical protein